MSLEAIRKNILAEAEGKAKAISAEASSEADAISSEAEVRAGSIVKNASEDAKREVERLWKESDAGLETEKNTMIVEARGAVLEHALKTVRSEAQRSLERENLQGILKSGLKQFSAVTGGSDAVIRTSKKNASLLNGRSNKVEYGDVDGFIISTPDGKISLNATVESIVDRELDTIRKLVADEIFTPSEERRIAQASKNISARPVGSKKSVPAKGQKSMKKAKIKAKTPVSKARAKPKAKQKRRR